MSDAKIQFSIGPINFSGEGSQDWLEKQLDKLIKAAPTLAPLKAASEEKAKETLEPVSADVGTLAGFLAKNHALSNQTARFLATSEWLHLKGSKRLTPKEVAKALATSNQRRLGNPSDCLAKNITKGFCEKDGSSYFVTPEGRQTLK